MQKRFADDKCLSSRDNNQPERVDTMDIARIGVETVRTEKKNAWVNEETISLVENDQENA